MCLLLYSWAWEGECRSSSWFRLGCSVALLSYFMLTLSVSYYSGFGDFYTAKKRISNKPIFFPRNMFNAPIESPGLHKKIKVRILVKLWLSPNEIPIYESKHSIAKALCNARIQHEDSMITEAAWDGYPRLLRRHLF